MYNHEKEVNQVSAESSPSHQKLIQPILFYKDIPQVGPPEYRTVLYNIVNPFINGKPEVDTKAVQEALKKYEKDKHEAEAKGKTLTFGIVPHETASLEEAHAIYQEIVKPPQNTPSQKAECGESETSVSIPSFLTPFIEPTVTQDNSVSSGYISSNASTPIMNAPNTVISSPKTMESSSAFPVQSHTKPQMLQHDQSGSVEILPANMYPAKKSPKRSAYDTAQTFKNMVPLFVNKNKLYMFTGQYYHYLSCEDAQRYIVELCREDVKRAGTPRFAKDVYDCLMQEMSLVVEDLRMDPKVITFMNGNLLLQENCLVPHAGQYASFWMIQCNYQVENAKKSCPWMDHFLNQISGGDLSLIARIWEMIGYVLTADTSGKVFFLLQGVSNSGKSVLCSLIESFFEESVFLSLNAHELDRKFAVSYLEGKAVCISPDLPGKRLSSVAVSTLKQITGDDKVSGDVKYAARSQFRVCAKVILATNHAFLTSEQDAAFTQRIVTIPFYYPIPKEAQNKNLLEYLKSEKDIIAAKAIDAYNRLVRNSYIFSGHYEVNRAVELTTTTECVDIRSCVDDFVSRYFTVDSESVVFTGDAHTLFSKVYGPLKYNSFSQHFTSAAVARYGVEAGRKRREGSTNPISCLYGLRMIQPNRVI